MWPNGTLHGDNVTLVGTTADGNYNASASSNSLTAYYAFSQDVNVVWVSAPTFDSTTGVSFASGEWVQLEFPEPFQPNSINLDSDAFSISLAGSNDGGNSFTTIYSNSTVNA